MKCKPSKDSASLRDWWNGSPCRNIKDFKLSVRGLRSSWKWKFRHKNNKRFGSFCSMQDWVGSRRKKSEWSDWHHPNLGAGYPPSSWSSLTLFSTSRGLKSCLSFYPSAAPVVSPSAPIKSRCRNRGMARPSSRAQPIESRAISAGDGMNCCMFSRMSRCTDPALPVVLPPPGDTPLLLP